MSNQERDVAEGAAVYTGIEFTEYLTGGVHDAAQLWLGEHPRPGRFNLRADGTKEAN